jgi:hypothetical protein
MQYKVKVVEAPSPMELEQRINESITDEDVSGFEIQDVKTHTTFMPGAKVSRGGIFYLATIIFRK